MHKGHSSSEGPISEEPAWDGRGGPTSLSERMSEIAEIASMTAFNDKTIVMSALQAELLSPIASIPRGRDDLMDQAAAELSPYFENPKRMTDALNAGGLTYEHSFVRRNRETPWVDEAIRMMLTEFRAARQSDAHLCFQTWSSSMEAIDNGIANSALTARLQQDLDELDPALVPKSVLRDVGELLEGSLQPLARLRLAMRGVAGMRTVGDSDIGQMTFGEVLSELSSREDGGDMYRPPPFEVLASQWRNIAYHSSYVVKGAEVICTFGRPFTKRIVCSINDIVRLGEYINCLTFAHKVAFEIFSIDNLDALDLYAPEIQVTEYTRDGALAYDLFGEGFAVLKAGHRQGDNTWVLRLRDVYGRQKNEAKVALQKAMRTYIILAGATAVTAWVSNGRAEFKFSFRGSAPGRDDE